MSTAPSGPQRAQARHSIAVVSRRTGISQLVLRAWERRYQAVVPARTDTGRRRYTDEDLEKLILLQTLTGAGHRIGDIAHLATKDLRDLAAELPAETVVAPRGGAREASELLARALDATARLDPRGLEQVLERALLDLSKPVLRTQLLAPLLSEIGERWQDGRLRVSHEHMATAIVASFLNSLNARQHVPSGAPLVAVATPAGQHHELGALMAASVALDAGWDVLYLGRDIPAEDLAAAVRDRGVRMVLLSLVYPVGEPAVAVELRELRRLIGADVGLAVGGRAAASYADVLGEIGAHLVTNDVALVSVLRGD
jgi:DNA-binding transcriptional MerR regulator/methylmalonyl-CoA mutase cobalamin-binding subunit